MKSRKTPCRIGRISRTQMSPYVVAIAKVYAKVSLTGAEVSHQNTKFGTCARVLSLL
jgi:hypothetical protein